MKKSLDQLNGSVIKGSIYKKGKLFDTFSLKLEKDGQTFYLNITWRYLLFLRVEKEKFQEDSQKMLGEPEV